MAPVDLNQALHIVGGIAPAGTLKKALHLSDDQVLINEDPVSCGPAPATRDVAAWRSMRETFIREMDTERPDFSFDDYAGTGLLTNVERLGREQAIVVWLGLDLQDQLLLAWVVFLFDQLGLDFSTLQVMQFEVLRPGRHVLSIGELSPDNIRNLSPRPRQLDASEVQALRRAWWVYTNDDPAALSKYAVESSPMPFVQRAFSELLYRYPDIHSGIGIWDERLLRHTLDHGPRTTRVIGYTLAFGWEESLDCVDDAYLFYRLTKMAAAKTPLVSLSGDAKTMRGCETTLTSFGRDVLAGNANNVHENGIDDWIGGVHLSGKASVTFRDGNSLVLG